MIYKKINLELIAVAEEAESVIAELNATLDRLEETRMIFGGGIDCVPVEHHETRKKSALTHAHAAGESAIGALRAAGEKMAGALKQIPFWYPGNKAL
jgi:hypothetical protein